MTKRDNIGSTYCLPAGSIIEIELNDSGGGKTRIVHDNGLLDWIIYTYVSDSCFLVENDIDKLKKSVEDNDLKATFDIAKILLKKIKYNAAEMLDKPEPINNSSEPIPSDLELRIEEMS